MGSERIDPRSVVGSVRTKDRRAEARKRERTYGTWWAREEGRTLDRVTPQTRDGGMDFVGYEDGQKVIGEVKHYDHPVTNYEFQQYLERAKRMNAKLASGATEGLTAPARQNAQASNTEVEVMVGEDLPRSWVFYHDLLFRYESVAEAFAQTTRTVLEHAARFVLETVGRVLLFLGRRGLEWWGRRSRKEKRLIAFIVVAVLIYFTVRHIRKRYFRGDTMHQ